MAATRDVAAGQLEVRPCSSRRAARRADGCHGRAGRRLQAFARVGAPALRRAARARPAGSPKYEVRVSIDGADRRGRRDVVHPGAAGPGREREDRGADGPRGQATRRGDRRRLRRARPRRRTTGSACAPSTTATGPGPHAVAELTTTQDQLHDSCPRSRLRASASSRPRPGDRRWSRRWRRCAAPATSCWPTVPLFAVAADLYGRSGPAAAGVLRRSDTARVLARQLLGPLATTRRSRSFPRSSQEVGRRGHLVVDKARSAPIIPPSCARGLPGYGPPSPKRTRFSDSNAHDQSAREIRPQGAATQDRVAGAHGLPAAARRLRARLHDHARRSRTRRCARSRACA